MIIAQNKQEMLIEQHPIKRLEDRTVLLKIWQDEYGRTKNEIFVEMRSLADYTGDWKKEGTWKNE